MARILLVDDDAEGLELRRSILEHHGHRVETATNPPAAREHFRAFSPECVIADLHLPDVDTGRALLRHFREQRPNVRIIILSGRPAAAEPLADVVLTKPARSGQLIDAINPAS